MRQDQLQKTRQTRWRQDGNALLTLDDAERWLAETPLCLYLPRYQHLPVPAPSFVEAVAGSSEATPNPAQIAAASQMLARLVASGAVIALNLFGSPSGIIGEQPDFLATPEALPYLYALQPQRNPKRPPTTTGATRVSPLAVEAFQILTREGILTAAELRERLGREVTEAATLRALGELWHAMRVVPVPDEHGAPAHWELLNARHARELNIGSTQSQTTALSILASFYLQSTIAATAEETEIFLSPLASRSRIREVIHGLSTTRQLASFSLNGAAQLYVEGTLPEIAEEEAEPAETLEANVAAEEKTELAGLEQNEPSFREAAAAQPAAQMARKPYRRPETDQRRRERPSFADRARRPFKPRPGVGQDSGVGGHQEQRERPPRREGGFRRPERGAFRREDRPEQPAADRSAADRPDRRSFEKPSEGEKKFRRGGDKFDRPRRSFERPPRRSFGSEKPGTERRSFRRDNERRPFGRDREQDRRPSDRERDRGSFGPESGRPPFRGEKDRRPFRDDREQRPFRRRDEGQRGGRPPRHEDRSQAGGRDRRPFPPREQRRGPAPTGGERRPFRRRDEEQREGRPPRREDRSQAGGRDRRPVPPREQRRGPAPTAGERRPFRRRDEEQRESRPPRREDRSQPGGADRRPYPPRDQRRGPAPFGGERRPFRKPGFAAGDRPRPGFKPRREGEAGAPPNSRKPFGKSYGKPGGRPPAKGNFKFKGKGPNSKRSGGFTPQRPRPRPESGGRKPGRESGEGDEG